MKFLRNVGIAEATPILFSEFIDDSRLSSDGYIDISSIVMLLED